MRKILTFLFAALMSVGTIFAERVQIGDLYYNLDAGNNTAEVTYQDLYETNYPDLTTVNIPESVEYNSVTYTVTSIGESAFMDCTGLTSVTIPNSVTSIGIYAFYYCSGLTSITIPNSVISIGDYAFMGCSGLTSITIPNSVISIGDYAFMGCSGLTSITIPNSVTSIGEGAFFDCTGLTSVTIPNNVTSIGQMAFAKCSGLTSITIPNSVISIGNYAFSECSGLTSVTIGNSVTSIGESAFQSCIGLTSIEIPSSVTSIGYATFAGCTGLASIEIPNSVTSIGMAAFAYCSGLASVTINATTPPTLGSAAFVSTAEGLKIYVPAESVADYKAAENWSAYAGQIEAIAGGDEPATQEITPNVDPQNDGVYYSTFYDSAKKYELPAGVEAYVATIGENVLNLTRIAVAGQVIPNDNAVILKSTVTPFTLTPSEADAVTFSATNSLQGTDDAIGTPANCYVLSGEDGVVGFYPYSGTNLNPHKAYVIYSGSNNAPRRMPFIFDAATGVENVQGNVQSTKVLRDGQLIIIRNGVEYNANGMMVK